ncbi:Laccase-1 [Fusarium odoratissimum]|uniref:Laccase-1 n=1 Tax=Fusarium oxysporum f. sp. cubense (strain race 4) TaxID=2502994 RepID=N1S7P0_FUSC4|nr:Laccase-1 [Fusarium odoratissimum]
MTTPRILSFAFLLLLFSCFANCLRRYNFTVTSQWSAADGHGRPVFAINGKTPGPLVTAEEGEEIEVFVDNQLATETTMHWHGVYQVDRPWNDGVPGVTQYSIQPRDNYTYRFSCKATNGELEVIMAEEGEEWVWINFIHSGAHHELQISIDEHEFYVVAADGEFVHPQKVHAANCNLGERIRLTQLDSILVHLNQKPGDYAIRLTSLRVQQVIQGLGILRYASKANDQSVFVVPNTKPWVHLNGTLVSSSLTAMDETKLAPFPERPPPRTADSTLKLFVNMTGPAAWSLGLGSHQAFRQQLPPLLWEDESRANVTTQHPFHKHNHKAWIIGYGHGGFPWATVEEAIDEGSGKFFNFEDPPIRDGCRLGNATGDWTVIRYQITFPAASMLHCHMIHHFGVSRYCPSHLIAGLANIPKAGQQLVLLEGVESMAKIPQEVKNKVHADFVPNLRYGPLD